MEYRFRRPTQDDLQGVIALTRTAWSADSGEDYDPTEWLTTLFRTTPFDDNGWVVEDESGRLVAAGIVHPRHPTRIRSVSAVLPAAKGQGIGSELLARLEDRAAELAREAGQGDDVWLGVECASSNTDARRLFESHGFEHVRYFWTMGIELDEEPPEPEWPDGIVLERARRDVDERAVFEASEDAFQDHWDHKPQDYDEWRQWTVERDRYDPSLWLLAREGDEIAGISLLFIDSGEGWVGVLGVRRPWRRRGIAKALLYASFREIRERGKPRAVLGVDAANPTGATRLYESVGMRVLTEEALYRKLVR